MNLSRTEALIGKEKLETIRNKKIVIVGIGGVGGYTLESLVRMGINNITIIDFDKFDETNINRQLLSTMNNVGSIKVLEAMKRYKEINPLLNLMCVYNKVNKDNIETLLNKEYDFIIDCCDDIKAKVELIRYAENNNMNIITSCGTAKRIDASLLKITRLDKTENDPLAKRLRSELRNNKLSLKIPCLCSSELAKDIEVLGSVSYVPAVAGLLITNYVINEFLK